MLRRVFRKALPALIIYCCIAAVLRWSPWATGKIKPYLHSILTESTDLNKVRGIIAELFFGPAPSLPEPPQGEPAVLKEAERDGL